jgi:hypothetical protein
MARRAERRFAAPVLSAAAGAPPALEVAGSYRADGLRALPLSAPRTGPGWDCVAGPPPIAGSLNALNDLHHRQVRICSYEAF